MLLVYKLRPTSDLETGSRSELWSRTDAYIALNLPGVPPLMLEDVNIWLVTQIRISREAVCTNKSTATNTNQNFVFI